VLLRFASMLAPLAPHFGEECWEMIGNENSIYENPVWFNVDDAALTVNTVVIGVQVNGKMRTKLELPVDSSEEVVKSAAFADDKVKRHTEGLDVVKEIYVKNRIYNIVVRK